MSKFLDLVTAEYTGRHLPTRPAALAGFVMETDISPSEYITHDKEYRVSLKFERFTRAPGDLSESAVMTESIRSFKNELKHLIYSDMAPLLHNMRELVYRADDQELEEALQMLMDEVMGEPR